MLAGLQNALARLPRINLGFSSTKAVMLLCLAAVVSAEASKLWASPAGSEEVTDDCEPLCNQYWTLIWNFGAKDKAQYVLSNLGDFAEEFVRLNSENLVEMAANVIKYCSQGSCDLANSLNACVGASKDEAEEFIKLAGLVKVFRPDF